MCRQWVLILCLVLFHAAAFAQATGQLAKVTSKDGTRISVECAGKGPNLLIVHGGSGDRQRWKPLLPLFASHFNVCAMDRRGHGESEPGGEYSLKKESEDVAAVVDSLAGPVFVLGHSIGGVFALEAAFLTEKISKLVLYEPPVQDLDHRAIADEMERMIQKGNREQALLIFLRQVVMISPEEIEKMKARPNWPERVAGVDVQIREIRALSQYRFDPGRMKTLTMPTLILTGGDTASPQLKQAVKLLAETLPNATVYAFEGQEHDAMDTVPQQFAGIVMKFLEER